MDKPTFWKDVCRVDYTTDRVLHNPYQTTPTGAAYTRGNTFSLQDWTLTNDSVTINSTSIIPEFIDRADLAQIGYNMIAERSDRQATGINLVLEGQFLGDYANFGTTIDDGSIAGTSGAAITLSATNVDDVIRAIKQQIYTNNGGTMYSRNGGFVIWDPTNFNLLEAFAMSNGYMTQDSALRGGVSGVNGFDYMGLTHYVSNSLTTATSVLHVAAGVKKAYHLGILSTTYGVVNITDGEAGLRSGKVITSRVDYAGKVWNNIANLLMDVQIAA